MERPYSCSMRPCCACGVMYEPNKASYVARAAARKMHVLLDLYTRLCEYFAAHPCVDCGEPDPVVLEFDHVAEKSDEIASMVCKGHSWNAILRAPIAIAV